MTVASSTARVSYAGNGTTVTFAVNFYFLEDSHLQVIIRSATGTETVKTLLTDYTVTGAGNPAGGSITFGTAPTNTETIVITRAVPLTQQTDYLANDPFPAESHEQALDKLTMMVQQQQDALNRSIKLSVTNTIGSTEFTVGATDRANKILAFDSAGELAVAQEIGTYRGNWATSTSYQERDLIKDTSNDNIYICVEAHTSTGTQPISTNADVSKWALIVDAASAAAILASAEAARDAAQLAETGAEAAELSANNWATKTDGPVAGGEFSAKYHALAASSSATDAQNAQTAAESARDQTLAAFDSFDDRYLGTKTADPTLDNDGNPLIAGALYFNSVDGIMKVYTGSVWAAAYVSGDGFLAASNNLSDLASAPTSLTNLGGTTVGKAVFTAATVAAAQQAMDVEVGVDVQALLVSGTNIKTINSTSLLGSGDIVIVGAVPYGLFRKADPTIVAWSKTGNFTATTATTLYIEVNGILHTIASGTSITMPGSATAGTDYAIWAKTDGTLEATSNHTSPPTANARKVGGFHYAPGGNASAQSGGNTTAQINEYSFWDLKWRPTAPDPRGMTLVGGGFWADIYLTGVDAITNGSSKYNVTMADGSSPPKVPTMFGGNGSTTYGSYTWFEAMELATAFGKRCPTQQEFMSLAYGTTEASSIGTDQVSTILNASYTSKWGVIQSTGVLWVWGRDRGGPFAGASWNANTEGRGSEYNAPNAGILGGGWGGGSVSGSRCSVWNNAASDSGDNIGSRFVCDHLQLD